MVTLAAIILTHIAISLLHHMKMFHLLGILSGNNTNLDGARSHLGMHSVSIMENLSHRKHTTPRQGKIKYQKM